VEKRIRTQILKTEKSCFEITKRKTRSDAVSENVKRTVFDFWCSPSVSRTSSNKRHQENEDFTKNIFVSSDTILRENTN
jgi:hypothetical protein